MKLEDHAFLAAIYLFGAEVGFTAHQWFGDRPLSAGFIAGFWAAVIIGYFFVMGWLACRERNRRRHRDSRKPKPPEPIEYAWRDKPANVNAIMKQD